MSICYMAKIIVTARLFISYIHVQLYVKFWVKIYMGDRVVSTCLFLKKKTKQATAWLAVELQCTV